jgi:hypothetical protein
MPILKRLTQYTIGDLAIEVVLIILGITGALWLDGVKDTRDERRLEESILREMVRTLESDTTDLGLTVEGLARTTSAIDTVLVYLDEGRAYTPDLDGYFASAAAAYGLFPNGAAYESLRSAGLQVVQSDSLRQRIVRYYDFQVPAVRSIEEMRVFPYRVTVLLPQLTTRFEFSATDAATPTDYRALIGDAQFRDVLRLWRFEVALQQLLTDDAHRGAKSLLGEIESELKRR